jgi:hypothetical protein
MAGTMTVEGGLTLMSECHWEVGAWSEGVVLTILVWGRGR